MIFGKHDQEDAQGSISPNGFVLAEFGLWEPLLCRFLHFPFLRNVARKVRKGLFPPCGFALAEFGLWEFWESPDVVGLRWVLLKFDVVRRILPDFGCSFGISGFGA